MNGNIFVANFTLNILRPNMFLSIDFLDSLYTFFLNIPSEISSSDIHAWSIEKHWKGKEGKIFPHKIFEKAW